ncbi:hypothetical protein [Mammaliicoccus sciuri]|uniref:hypothetical protein n=1 Tax=Mammaliicoccus sciuri TaxID=1296 RepID=UPI003F5735AF
MDKLNELLKSKDVPRNTKEMVLSMNTDGLQLLNDCYDVNSKFYRSVQPEIIARQFYADPKVVKNLYHYTNVEAFEKIIASKQFLIGSIHYMNDTKEVKYVYELMESELKNLNAPEDVVSMIKRLNIELPYDTYVWSFSENNYSQALSKYGDLALGFENSEIMRNLGEYYSRGRSTLDEYKIGNAYVFPLKVEYNLQIQLDYIKELARAWIVAHENIKYDSPDMSEVILGIVQALYFFSLFFKNPYLRQEEEIRYIIQNINSDSSLNPEIQMNDKPFAVCKMTSEMLKEVIINRDNADKKTKIESLLKNHSFEGTKVSITKLPY